jgi:hypothetical protein
MICSIKDKKYMRDGVIKTMTILTEPDKNQMQKKAGLIPGISFLYDN